MRKRTIWILAAVLVLAAAVLGAYTVIGSYYRTHFFEHTSVNGIDISDLTAPEAEALIAEQAEDYRVTVRTKEDTQEVIEGSDIGYRFVSNGEVQEFLESQNVFAWLPAYLGSGSDYTMEAAVTYDKALLRQAAGALACMQEENVTAPADARVERQEDGTWGIVPEVEGNQPDAQKVLALLEDTVDNGGREIDLEEADCYRKPAVRSEDGALRAEAAIMNRYSSITVTYDLGGGVTETLDAATTSSWFSLDENRQPAFDREAVAAWVNQLADKYDTIGRFLPFVTSNGETVYPESRTYGWQMDREGETEALYQLLLAGDSAQRSPLWLEGAQTRGDNDIGNTYVEIDYTNQRLWYYKDGALLVETPVVTGNVGAGTPSPEGVFCLVGKSEDETLVGEGYKTPVEYWMPFYGGVGIHDADSWRTVYGGDIYQWSGSHGCINTPTAQVAVLYQNIEVGTPVICYSSGVNYGYSQVSGGGGTSGGSSDVQIVPGGDGNGSGGSAAGGDSSNASGGGAAGSSGGSTSGGDIVILDGTGQSVQGGDTPPQDGSGDWSNGGIIDLPEEWSDESVYNGEQVIY